ncbi:MAG TPA: phosphoglycerate mutase family protein [Dongiaceae bacterium]
MAPQTVILLRHAEKPANPDDPHLSPAGRVRAQKLANWLPHELGAEPDVILAAASKLSQRPYETVMPLAAALHLPIDTFFADQDHRALAHDLLTEARYASKLIALCWNHKHLPALARELGAPEGSYPDPWPEELFNLILRFDFAAATPVKVAQLTEQL